MNNQPGKSSAEPKGNGGDIERKGEELRYLSAIENEVRRRLQDILGSAGLSSDGVAKEVLYWLPAEFLEWYKELFLKALQLNQEQGKGRVNQKKADLGRVLVDEKEHKGRMIGAGAGGQKGGSVRGGAWVIRDEEALEELGRVNKELLLMYIEGLQGRDKFVKRIGVIVDRAMEGKRRGEGEGRIRRVCGDCNKLMATEWKRCPFHG